MEFDFPTSLQGEGPSLDAATILQAQHSGDWARKFGGGSNNLIQRQRHRADIARETEVMQQAQEQAQLNRIRTNKTEQDLWIRSKKLDMDLKVGEANLALREQTFMHKEQMLPVELEAKRAATNAANARERATTTAAAMKARLQERKDSDTSGFADEMQKITSVPGTQDFARAAIETRLKYPGMDSAVFDDLWKSHSGSELEPAEALKRFEATRQAVPDAGVTVSPSGVTIRSQPDTVAKDKAALQARYDKYLFHRSSSTVDPAQVPKLDAEIAQMKSQLDGFDKGLIKDAPAAPARERTATNPATGAKMVFRNGAWQPQSQ